MCENIDCENRVETFQFIDVMEAWKSHVSYISTKYVFIANFKYNIMHLNNLVNHEFFFDFEFFLYIKQFSIMYSLCNFLYLINI